MRADGTRVYMPSVHVLYCAYIDYSFLFISKVAHKVTNFNQIMQFFYFLFFGKEIHNAGN